MTDQDYYVPPLNAIWNSIEISNSLRLSPEETHNRAVSAGQEALARGLRGNRCPLNVIYNSITKSFAEGRYYLAERRAVIAGREALRRS